jgi:DNA-binding NarL/FixJ family response regulator
MSAPGLQALIRVAIAGGHPAVRGVVRLSCEATDGLMVAGETEDAAAAADLCELASADVVVLDGGARGIEGLAGLRDLRTRRLHVPVLFLVDQAEGPVILEALRLGVSGFLSKADDLRSCGPATLRVASGERLVSDDYEAAAVAALGGFAQRAREGSAVEARLTERELQILRLVSEGLTLQQAGTRLGISPRTVETHVAKLYRKLGVRTRVQAVSRASQLGLLGPG